MSMLFVLACCHSVQARPRANGKPIEGSFATKASGVTGSRGADLSFMQKLLRALKVIKQAELTKECIDPVEITAHLKQNSKTGELGHAILRGAQRLSFYFSAAPITTANSQPATIAKVLLRIHLSEGSETEKGQEFLAHLQQVSDTVARIVVLGVDRSCSTVILMRCAVIWGVRLLLPTLRESVLFLNWAFVSISVNSTPALAPLDRASDPSWEIKISSDFMFFSDAYNILSSSPPTSPICSSVKSDFREEAGV